MKIENFIHFKKNFERVAQFTNRVSQILLGKLSGMENTLMSIRCSKDQMQNKLILLGEDLESISLTCNQLKLSNSTLQSKNDNYKFRYSQLSNQYQSSLSGIHSLFDSFFTIKSSFQSLWCQVTSVGRDRISEFSKLKNCLDLYRVDSSRKIETIHFIQSEYSSISERLSKVNEERLWHANECQAIKNQSSETIYLLDSELNQYRLGWNQMKEEMRSMALKIQQYKTQCTLSAEDNDHLIKEMTCLHSKLAEYEKSINLGTISSLESKVMNLEKTIADFESENENLKQENERLIQHHNMKQKLQYHVKIKQENNDLKELLRVSKEENGALRQVNFFIHIF